MSRDADARCILNTLFFGGKSSIGIIEDHQQTQGQTTRETLGIWGIGGLGKTVLARVIYTEVKIRYGLHTAWVVLGQEPYLIGIFEDLHYQLVGKHCSFFNQEAAQQWLKTWSQTKRVFIVLDDVWNPEHAELFNVLGLRGRFLITTRNQRVLLHINAGIYELGNLQREDSRMLLLQVANTTEDQIAKCELQETVTEILKILCDIPLAVSTVGAALRVVESESFQKTIWIDALADLQQGGESILERLDKVFDLSFHALSPELQNVFLHMALFAEDVEISSKVVAMVLSSKSTNCMIDAENVHRQVRQGLRKLKERSLLQFSTEADGVTYYWIHDHLLRYVKQKQKGLEALHLSLLEAYKKHHIQNKHLNGDDSSSSDDDEEEDEEESKYVSGCGEETTTLSDFPWWEIEEDGYFYNHIAFHMVEAGLTPVFRCLLLSYQWLQRKISCTGVSGLLADCDAFRKINQGSKSIKLLHESLLLNADSVCHDQALLGPHLIGSLGEVQNSAIRKFIGDTKIYLNSNRVPVLVPRARCLTQPGQVLKKIFCHSFGAAILSATVRKSGIEFLAGSSTGAGSVRLGHMDTGETFRLGDANAYHSSLVTCLALDPLDRYVISASCDSSLKLWPLPDKIGSMMKGKVTTIGYHKEDVYCVAVTSDGLYAVSGSLDQTIKIWKLETCECILTLVASAIIRGVCVAKNDSVIISCAADSTVSMWNFKTGTLMKSVKVGTRGPVYGIAKSSDESSLAFACTDKTIRLLMLSTLEEESTPFEGHVDEVICCCFSSDKKLLFSGDNAGLMIIWCVDTRAVLQEIFAHSAPIRSIVLTPDQGAILTSSTDDSVKLWRNQHQKKTKKHIREKDAVQFHRDVVTHLAVSPSGKLVASASRDKTIGIWDVRMSKQIESLTTHDVSFSTVEFFPHHCPRWNRATEATEDGLESNVVSGSKDGKIIIWNWQEKSSYILGSHPHSVQCLCISDNGTFVFSGSVDSIVLMWDPWKRFLVCRLSCGDRAGVRHLSFSGGCQTLSAGLIGSVVTWNIESIVEKLSKRPDDCRLDEAQLTCQNATDMTVPPSDVIFEPEQFPFPSSALPRNEIFIASNRPNNNIRVCRLQMRRESKLRTGHNVQDTVTALYVSEDETIILSGSLSGSIRIFWRIGCDDTISLSDPWQDGSQSCAITAITALWENQIVLAGHQNGQIWAWDCRHYGLIGKKKAEGDSPKPYLIGVHDSSVNKLLPLNMNMVVSSSNSKEDPVLKVWDLTTFTKNGQSSGSHTETQVSNPAVPLALILKGHSGPITDIVVVTNLCLLSSSLDGDLLMWRISPNSENHMEVNCRVMLKSESYAVRHLALTPCKQVILCATCQNCVELWNIEGLKLMFRLPIKFNINKMAVLPDNRRLMCFYEDLSIELRCLETGDCLTEFQVFQGAWGQFCILRGNEVISDFVHCSVKVWDRNTRRVICHVGANPDSTSASSQRLKPHRSCGDDARSIHYHSRRITALDWFGSSHLITGSYDRHLKLWNLSSDSVDCVCQFVFEHTVTAIRSLNTKLVTVGLSDGNVYFMDVLNLVS